MKEFKTCQECGMEFRSIGSFGTHKKVTYCHCNTRKMTSQLPPGKIEEMVEKTANKIVYDKNHSEDVLQELRS